MGANMHLNLPPGVEVDGGIGLFHVHGHREECTSVTPYGPSLRKV